MRRAGGSSLVAARLLATSVWIPGLARSQPEVSALSAVASELSARPLAHEVAIGVVLVPPWRRVVTPQGRIGEPKASTDHEAPDPAMGHHGYPHAPIWGGFTGWVVRWAVFGSGGARRSHLGVGGARRVRVGSGT